jgi:hypothetical protein
MSVNFGFRTAGRLASSVLLGLGCIVGQVRAQTFSPYSEFQAMSLADLSTLQVKLTYIGAQSAPSPALIFAASLSIINPSLFTPYRRPPATNYAVDDHSPATITASTSDLKALIDSVGTLPDVTDGDVDANGDLSFSLLNTAGGTTKAFEAIVDSTNGRALFDKLLVALRNNASAVRGLRTFGCVIGSLPVEPPTSVQGQVQVKSSGLRADRQKPTEYVGKVRVTNTSGSTITAPLFLVVIVHADADLYGRDGETCNIAPPGHPFMIVKSSGGLAAGAFIERPLRFTNPSKSKLNVEFKVFAGPGTP